MSDIISQRSIRNKKIRFIHRERMLVLISKLSVAVDTFCFGLAKRSYEHRSFILVTSGFGIDNTQFTMLRSMMSHKYSHHFTSTGNLAGLCHRRREPAVHTVIFRLSCSIRIHLEQRLCPYLSAVVIIPTGINDTTVIEQCRSNGMHLVETYLAHIASFSVTQVHIADFGKPAVYRTSATGGVEKDIFIGQIDSFDISMSLTESQLLDIASLQVHLIQMEIVFLSRLLP